MGNLLISRRRVLLVTLGLLLVGVARATSDDAVYRAAFAGVTGGEQVLQVGGVVRAVGVHGDEVGEDRKSVV